MTHEAGAPPIAREVAPSAANERMAQLVARIEGRQDQFMALLGSKAAVERFKTVALHAVTSRPDLLDPRIDMNSLIEAVREAATLDLEPTGILGEAWLVPYKGTVKLRVGWQGYLKLIRRSQGVAVVDCQVVYAKDQFRIEMGTSPTIYHIPTLEADRGGFLGAYAYARMANGTMLIEWMAAADIEAVRRLAARDSLMWGSFPGEGYRKVVLRRLSKRLPKSAQVERAIVVEDEGEEFGALPQPSRPTAQAAALAALADRFPIQDGQGEAQDGGQQEQPTEESDEPETAPEAAPGEANGGDFTADMDAAFEAVEDAKGDATETPK